MELRVLLPYVALCVVNAGEAVEVLSAGYILAQVTSDPHVQSAVAASVFLGMLFGGLASGVASDHLGRVLMLRLATSLAALGMIGVAVSGNLVTLLFCRWLSGLGVGAATPPMFAIVPDMTRPRWAGLAVVSISCFWMVGSLYTALVALLVLPAAPAVSGQQPNWGVDAPWRVFAAICGAVPLTATLLVTLFVSEPPNEVRLLVSTPTLDSPPPAGSRVRAATTDLPASLAECAGGWPPGSRIGAIVTATAGTVEGLIAVRSALMPLLMCWWGLNFAYYGLSTWIAVVVERLTLGNTYLITLMYQLASLPANMLAIFLVVQPTFTLWRRKCLLVLGMSSSAACAFGLSALSSANAEARDKSAIIGLALLSQMGSAAGWAMLDCISTESFDSSVRGAAIGLLGATGRIASISAQLINGALISHTPLLFSVMGAFMAAGCLGAIALRPHER